MRAVCSVPGVCEQRQGQQIQKWCMCSKCAPSQPLMAARQQPWHGIARAAAPAGRWRSAVARRQRTQKVQRVSQVALHQGLHLLPARQARQRRRRHSRPLLLLARALQQHPAEDAVNLALQTAQKACRLTASGANKCSTAWMLLQTQGHFWWAAARWHARLLLAAAVCPSPQEAMHRLARLAHQHK